MALQARKCHVCQEMHDVVMNSKISKAVKVCFDCYIKLDRKNRKDYGLPEVKKNLGTHGEDDDF